MKSTSILALAFFIFISGCMMTQKDTFLWLEEIDSKPSLEWVGQENLESERWFNAQKNYFKRKKDSLNILESKDRILNISIYDSKYVYNFWKDEKNPKGLLRRSDYKLFILGKPKWKKVLDVDHLSKAENENWVFKGQIVFQPHSNKSLMFLSRGGKDAIVVREFDLLQSKFVDNGFFIPEAKTNVSWVNENQILLGTNFGPNSMTDSGYPRIIKLLNRGQKLIEAKTIFEAKPTDMSASSYSKQLSDGNNINLISRVIDFYNDEKYFLNEDMKLIKTNIPLNFDVMGLVDKTYILKARKDSNVLETKISSGSLVALNFNEKNGIVDKLQIIFQPKKNQNLDSVHITKSFIVLNVLEDVKSKMYFSSNIDLTNTRPMLEDSLDNYNVEATYSGIDDLIYISEGFLTPAKMHWLNLNSKKQKTIQSKKATFYSKKLVVRQEWAVSQDGTRVPYFIIHNKNLKKNKLNKTLLYAYGGFEISLLPNYLNTIGKQWLEKDGVYVLANIRGGGEFGPAWHQAALKEKRHKAFEDFIAVAEDLIAQEITSSNKLAIQGGSNGGLLVGSVMTMRPDLFGAVVCLVPLLDMLNYHKLLAGSSWMAEYGNPEVSKDRRYLASYSPYQNLSSVKKYPSIFLYTSTKDDRVHPGHARKMAAKMKSLGADVLYYENTEGGHAGSSNFQQSARLHAMIYTFLNEKLN